jgi:subtilisin family serine protease
MAQARSLAAAAAGILFLCSPLARAQNAAPPKTIAQPAGIALPAPTGRPSRLFDDTSVLVRFKAVAPPNLRAMARAQVHGTRLRAYSIVPGLEHIRLAPGQNVDEALAALRRLPFVAYAHRNPVIHIDQQLPNDPYFAEQWALHNTGQDSSFGVWLAGTPDADIDWPEAWAVPAATSGSVVAILDTGIDYRHSDLAPNVWLNLAELNGTPGVDDDGNGYVDDIRGWDFVNNDNSPLDGNGHGTHVAGTIAAVVNNLNGVAGVMWTGKVMALKILDDAGSGLLSDAVAALEYATAKGVRVANNSWGYSDIAPGEVADHQALHDAIQAAAAANLLFVAAAGNDAVDTDITPHYPSAFNLDNIISVAATDNTDQLASFSNWGAVSVDLGAPGVDVFSTYMLFAGAIDDYAWLSGTSMATPHVSGVAGLLAGIPACQTYGKVRDQIFSHVRPLVALSGLTATGGMLNIHDALAGSPCTVVPPPDADSDGVPDSADNCTLVANPTQLDSDGDGYGNACDPDFNNDGVININDLNRMKARLNVTPVIDVATDLDGDGAVNINDLNRLKSFLGKPPGPSGLHPNCPPTCP